MASRAALYYAHIESPCGMLELIVSAKGLKKINVMDQRSSCLKGVTLSIERTQVFATQLQEYFDGTRTEFDFPLDLEGTPFQKLCWEALARIPYGKTCSYSQQAEDMKNPKALRAVGQANGRNPVPIVIPCHRVIASDGSLGGFSCGLNMKKFLLAHERKVSSKGGNEEGSNKRGLEDDVVVEDSKKRRVVETSA
eukprot:TRINITY_DN1425_c0_g2_i1.p1 TRINITY_DN1425_c0_g2~~TRINITY_DN1425_c0_g2_i1.p1  ORF type:complete len:195 (-),score=39.01 TRINITY_DN1425_c0_g2_i1:244-828(-)